MSFGFQRGVAAASPLRERLSWLTLLGLLAALLVSVTTFDRGTWPALFGDEATFLMSAQSLAWDGDLTYSRADYERFLDSWGAPPEGLILQSGDGGASITYGKPFFYPLAAAALVRLSPTRGLFGFNALFLALAALMSARVLSQMIGALAPLWVAVLIFVSVSFVYTFQAHSDLFLLSCAAIAWSLIFAERSLEGSGRPATSLDRVRRNAVQSTVRLFVAGALLAIVIFSRPLYAPLLLPAVMALPKRPLGRSWVSFGLGILVLVGMAATVHRNHSGSWTSYGAERRGFYTSTGFPDIDFPADEWADAVEIEGNAAWSEANRLTSIPPVDARLWGWNSVYLALGRNVGLLPYFSPLIVVILGGPKRMLYWSILTAVALSLAAFFLYRPFNFYGGGGAIANRYFLALYPALWFLSRRKMHLRQIVLTVLLGGAFLWPLWRAPRSYPLNADKSYSWVSSVAYRLLPYETTQSHLKPSGRSDMIHNRLWVKFLTPSLRLRRDESALLLERGRRGDFLVASSRPLAGLTVQMGADSTDFIQIIGGATVDSDEEVADGRQLRLKLGRPRARHPMWWTWEDVFIYEIRLRSASSGDGRVSFTLTPIEPGEVG